MLFRSEPFVCVHVYVCRVIVVRLDPLVVVRFGTYVGSFLPTAHTSHTLSPQYARTGVYVTGDIDDAYFRALRDHRSDSILSGDASGDVDSLPARGSGSGSNSAPSSGGNSPQKSGGLARKVQEMRIEEGDEERGEGEGDILAVDGVEAAKSSGQLGQARPRGRMIGARREANGNGAANGTANGNGMAVDALAAADPQNHPNGLRNEDMERLRDRFSGWV